MIEFKIQASLAELEKVLTETVSPRSYWLHTQFGGSGWMVSDAHQAIKIVSVDNDQLATLVRLKIK